MMSIYGLISCCSIQSGVSVFSGCNQYRVVDNIKVIPNLVLLCQLKSPYSSYEILSTLKGSLDVKWIKKIGCTSNFTRFTCKSHHAK